MDESDFIGHCPTDVKRPTVCYKTRKRNWYPCSVLQNLISFTKAIIRSLSACKKIAQFFNSLLRYSQFQSYVTCSDMFILDNTHQNVILATFASLNLYKLPKNHFVPSIHSCDPANVRVLSTKRLCSFMTIPTQKSLNQLLIFMSFHQHAKTQTISSIFFRNIVDLTSVGQCGRG